MQSEEIQIPSGIVNLLSGAEAWSYRLVPYRKSGDGLRFWGEEGRDYTAAIEELEVLTGEKIGIDHIGSDRLGLFLNRYYRGGGKNNTGKAIFRSDNGNNQGFLQELIRDAFRNYASDIHFEPFEENCRIRLRIDGKLIERHAVAKGNYMSLVNQVKILANMDISEKRLPQDGRMLYRQEENHFDVRVSTLPTIHGEKVVMRLLTRHVELLELKNLGFGEQQLYTYLSAVHKPHGLILISGPTGSGKSTTLYATLRLLNEKSRNILTIEDPVEYTLEGVNQVQLKEEIGLTFAGALRTFLRQDPDVIMLGEIRDADTAQMAIRSSLTGHLVFSTIHTNSAWGCISRLSDMGVHPYLISDTLLVCVAQRLVRLLCPACKQPAGQSDVFPGMEKGKSLYKAVGCEKCYYTGYSGRKAIYEVLPVDSEINGFIRNCQSGIETYCNRRNILTLRESALELLYLGMTSVEEVLPLVTVNNYLN